MTIQFYQLKPELVDRVQSMAMLKHEGVPPPSHNIRDPSYVLSQTLLTLTVNSEDIINIYKFKIILLPSS
jgi:hypothetical protein